MRVLLSVLAPLLGLALAAVGVLLVIEVVAAWVRTPATTGLLVPWPDWRASLEALTWANTPVPAIAIGVAVLGLLLLLVGLLARRHDIALSSPAPEVTVTTSPRVLAWSGAASAPPTGWPPRRSPPPAARSPWARRRGTTPVPSSAAASPPPSTNCSTSCRWPAARASPSPCRRGRVRDDRIDGQVGVAGAAGRAATRVGGAAAPLALGRRPLLRR